jgi:hypothetical protein
LKTTTKTKMANFPRRSCPNECVNSLPIWMPMEMVLSPKKN